MGLDDVIGKTEELAKEKVSGHDDQIDNAVKAVNAVEGFLGKQD
jgi:hypothetical protein